MNELNCEAAYEQIELNCEAAYEQIASWRTNHLIAMSSLELSGLKRVTRDVYLQGVRDGIEYHSYYKGNAQYVGRGSQTLSTALNEFTPLEQEPKPEADNAWENAHTAMAEKLSPSAVEQPLPVAEIEISWAQTTDPPSWVATTRTRGGSVFYKRVASLAGALADTASLVVAGALADLAAEVTGEHVSLFSIKGKRDSTGRVIATWTNEDAEIAPAVETTASLDAVGDTFISIPPETIAIREVASVIHSVAREFMDIHIGSGMTRPDYVDALGAMAIIADKLLDKHGAEAANNRAEQSEGS